MRGVEIPFSKTYEDTISHRSGETITSEHEWNAEGNYIIEVKAKDPDGLETDWTWLRITMPKSHQFSFFEWLNSHFPFLNWLPL